MLKRPRFVVAFYELDRCYGGPEEGGWWYDTGDLMRVHCVCYTEEAASNLAFRANRLLDRQRRSSQIRPLSSVAYAGGHYVAQVWEGTAPEHYPQHRPHYE